MNPAPSPSRPLFWLLVSVLALVACVRIVSTYTVFSQFYDEPFHIACGMEWLEKHVYLYERQHPPLSRIAVALPLYLRGLRGYSRKSAFEEGDAILNSHGEYMKNLAWARTGNLPFFLLSVLFLALLGERIFGRWKALIAVALYTLLPPVLGQAGLATTDMAQVGGFLAVLYAFTFWIENPSTLHSAMLGLAIGFALITKFSLIPFLGMGFLLTMVWLVLRRPSIPAWCDTTWLRQAAHLALLSLIAMTVIWSIYRFNSAPVVTGHGYRPPTAGMGYGLASAADWILDANLPLGEFLGGIGSVAIHNRGGHASFLLGSFRMTGWWYYFPVVLAVKTPLAFLVLTLIGIPIAVRSLWKLDGTRQALVLLFAAGILMSCMTARINLGVRHILPIYPLFALIAAQGIVTLAVNRRNATIMAALIAVLAIESAWAHPDYVASFNALAGRHPERILVNSDLDGGQDLKRLVDRLRELKVEHLKLAYFGSADLSQSGLPPFEELGPREHASGWLAVSAAKLEMECAADGSYCWLQNQKPFERIGQSIFLYHLDEPHN